MKLRCKELVYCFFLFVTFPLVALYILMSLVSNKDSCFAAFSQFLSLFPGKTGSYIRTAFYRSAMGRCDKNLYIGFCSIFSQQDTEVSEGVYIGPQCNIGLCSIGGNTLLGSGVHIMSGKGQHNFADLDTPIKDQGGTFEKIQIGEDCWIGNGALIMASIGKGSIVAAGSVVINNIPDYVIVAGNPAHVVKKRGNS